MNGKFRCLSVSVLILYSIIAAIAVAQMSPEEALKKMHHHAATRGAATRLIERPVSISVAIAKTEDRVFSTSRELPDSSDATTLQKREASDIRAKDMDKIIESLNGLKGDSVFVVEDVVPSVVRLSLLSQQTTYKVIAQLQSPDADIPSQPDGLLRLLQKPTFSTIPAEHYREEKSWDQRYDQDWPIQCALLTENTAVTTWKKGEIRKMHIEIIGAVAFPRRFHMSVSEMFKSHYGTNSDFKNESAADHYRPVEIGIVATDVPLPTTQPSPLPASDPESKPQ
jgi:hypothetical protein